MNSWKTLGLGTIFFTCLFINACVKDKEEKNTNSPYTLDIGTFPQPNLPADNPLTQEGVKLGRMLFYEKMLSKTNTISCGSCHIQQFAFTDTAQFSIGSRQLPGTRQSMSIFNMAWNSNGFFWDGRAQQLRDQIHFPITDTLEMDESMDNVVAKLQASALYNEQFNKAFGSPGIDADRLTKALEQFMLSIVSNQSKYDDYLEGKYTLTEQEERGRFLFMTEFNPGFPMNSGADCQHCHGGSNFENDQFMNNGLDITANFSDLGRALATGNTNDNAKFKVPSLRNIALTPPYMHDGRFKTLEEVVDHYNLVTESSTLDPSFRQQLPAGLQLTQADKAALVAFLKTLTDNNLITNPAFSDPF